jgi:hypothetical protein
VRDHLHIKKIGVSTRKMRMLEGEEMRMIGEIIGGGSGHHRHHHKREGKVTGKRDEILERGRIAEREVIIHVTIIIMVGRIDASLHHHPSLHLHQKREEERIIKNIIIRNVIHHRLIEVQVWTADDLN